MDKSSIGINAGRVWQKLSESNKRWEYEELKHALDLADRDLNAAIGRDRMARPRGQDPILRGQGRS